MTPLRSLLLAAALLVSAPALAHTDEWFDSHPPASGGQIRMAGPYHFELMPQQGKDGILVNVTDHGDKKVATAGWSAHAVVLSGGKKTRVTLKPAGDNTLRGAGQFGADAKIVISVKDQGGHGYSARFSPGSAKAPAGEMHDHEHMHEHTHQH